MKEVYSVKNLSGSHTIKVYYTGKKKERDWWHKGQYFIQAVCGCYWRGKKKDAIAEANALAKSRYCN